MGAVRLLLHPLYVLASLDYSQFESDQGQKNNTKIMLSGHIEPEKILFISSVATILKAFFNNPAREVMPLARIYQKDINGDSNRDTTLFRSR